ncbi:DUF4231 domain-containing protein [Sphingomonas sp. LY29]|uniref:DUF4231 domain-containing protein n=1 Tax=Sphingomonas sp. LY29 TaxID=3095341 RepID=UPI002D77635E|nr:DUF4231 domain-containing protein [Sphingomonas sp. LY29]WRP25014.1 DUF4231 domain-containing protein [Sphingomonas sp. LY29]
MARGQSPPLPPFAMTLGIVGHREELIAPHRASTGARIDEAIDALKASALALHERERRWFDASSPLLSLVSPLADGADQMAAQSAIDRGFALQAILPFAVATYRETLPDAARASFERLLDKAACRFELPGDLRQPLQAYVMAGRATVAQADILIAVWDGQFPRGRGGTGEVVEWAIARGTPVLQIPIDPAAPMTLIWSAYDPAVITSHSSDIDRRRFDRDQVDALLVTLLSPPIDPRERGYLERFGRERRRNWRLRLEYPMLLAATGVSRLGWATLRETASESAGDRDWHHGCAGCAGRHGVAVPLDLVGDTHRWSDRLASRYAQTYRSGHVLNFVLAASAVLIGLGGFLFAEARLWLAAIEFVLALTIIVNTRVGVAREWHRRWLDYRQLAERLRPFRSLKLIGIAAPDPPGSASNPVSRRWTEWYATAVWRAMGCASGAVTAAEVSRIAASIATHEVDPQVSYHRRNSRQIMALDERLERVSATIFIVTLLASVATIAALVLAPQWVDRWQDWLTLVSAGLPAVGTAVFGIRFQGDFGGSALRSDATATALGDLSRELRRPALGLSRVADLTEQAARAMFADLSEWRLVNQQHDLSISS